MILENPVTKSSGYCIAVSRASTAIYLVLRQLNMKGKSVLVPANLCYAGVYPILYAEMRPVFCDVDSITGNVSLEHVMKAIKEDTVVAIIPHMYGNPVKELMEIAEYCQQREIILIEDCASAMGAQSEDYEVGNIGDYVVYSTGYSKTLDLGFGGILFSSSNDLSDLEQHERELPEMTSACIRNMEFFSPLYRLIRNKGMNTAIAGQIFKLLPECCKDGFIHRLADGEGERLFSLLNRLENVVCERRKSLDLYQKQLNGIHGAQLYPYLPGAVPWRMNLLVDNVFVRRHIIDECLFRSLPVSDWYPTVTPMFGNMDVFPGAIWHEQHIINFPLPEKSSTIETICDVVKQCLTLESR